MNGSQICRLRLFRLDPISYDYDLLLLLKVITGNGSGGSGGVCV